MNRRTLIASAASFLGAAGVAVGSGAFSFTRAERDLEVTIEGDDDAYLGLRQLGAGGRSFEDGSPKRIFLSFPGTQERWYNANDPEGLGTDSVYEFVSDVANDAEGLVEITNQGTNDIDVWVNQQTPADSQAVEVFDVADSQREALTADDPYHLEVGESFRIGVRIDTHGVEIGDEPYREELTFVAQA